MNVECEGGMRACGALSIFHLLGDDDGGYVRLWSSSSLPPVNARNTPRCLWRSDKPVYSKALSIMPLIYASYIYIDVSYIPGKKEGRVMMGEVAWIFAFARSRLTYVHGDLPEPSGGDRLFRIRTAVSITVK